MKHCCKSMEFFLEEGSVDIHYSKKFRSYGIGMKNGTCAEQTINFCPWCGTKLPVELSDYWFDILEIEHGIVDTAGGDKAKVPAEFRTDEWWKKRGL